MEDPSEVEQEVELLLARRESVLASPDGQTRAAVLQAIEDVIVQLEMSELRDSPVD